MIGKGPVDAGRVIAGRNLVSVDSIGAHLLGLETLGGQHVRQTAENGLGEPARRWAGSPARGG